MAGRDRMKGGANAAWITEAVEPTGPDRRSTVTASEIAAVERREVRVPVTRRAAPQGASLRRCAFRRSAPLAYAREGKGRRKPRAARTKGPMNHVWLPG